MTRVVDAIYTNGHLKPVEPLDLAERERVTLIVQTHRHGDETNRKAALAAILEGIAHSTFSFNGKLPTRDELHDRS